MNNLIQTIAASSSNYPKAIFLMAAGILFVFAVQVVFYLIIRLWPKAQRKS
jgi:hypothetical protein